MPKIYIIRLRKIILKLLGTYNQLSLSSGVSMSSSESWLGSTSGLRRQA
jgi:hypothetical protein